MGLLTGKIALVTGASKGIGRAIAIKFAQEGAQVAFTYLSSVEKGLTLETELKSFGITAKGYRSDASDFKAADELINAVVADFGGLDILVNNAGIALGKQFEETTDEEFDRIMNINVRSVFRMTRAAVPQLKARGGGSVINLASIMSSTGGPQLSAYATSKHAVLGLSRGMAVDLGKYGIRVNALQPGSIWTGMSRPFFDDPNFRNYWEAKAPLGRIGDPIDVAVVALFLATDEAKFVSGAGVAIDGAAGVNF